MKNSLNILLLAAGLSFVTLHAGAQKIMTIEECIEAARKGNIWAKNAQNDILMAKEQKKFIHSKYYPMVSASFTHFEASKSLINYQIFDKETIDNFNAEMESDFTVGDFTLSFVKKASSAGLTFIEPVYTGGRLTNFNKLADLQVNARNMMSEVTDDQIVMGTEFLYYKIWELHETDKSLDAMEKELNFIHQDAFNYYDNGIVNKNDVLSVELMLDQLSALRIRANNDCRLLRRALAKFMGMADEDIDVDTTLNTEIIDPQQLRVDSHRAMEGRTETQLLDIWVEKAALEKKIAKANMLPIVAVGGRRPLASSASAAARLNGPRGLPSPMSIEKRMSRKGTSSTRCHISPSSETSCPGCMRPILAHETSLSSVSGPKVSSMVRKYHLAPSIIYFFLPKIPTVSPRCRPIASSRRAADSSAASLLRFIPSKIAPGDFTGGALSTGSTTSGTTSSVLA